MSATATRTTVSAERILARQEFVEKVLRYVTALVHRHGTMLSRDVQNSYTKTRIALENFEDFSFQTYGSYGMMGGEDATIWYHPGSPEMRGEPVLMVQWWEIAKCKVQRFNPSEEWQIAIQKLLDAAAAEEEARVQAEQERLAQEALARQAAVREGKLESVRSQLEEEARRLRFII